tara:strand:+ start:3049 stop:3894 length:846 start_codon:yes stop_codon:yes gene_type:complete
MKKYIYTLIVSVLPQFSTFSQPYTELGTLKLQKYSSDKNETNEYSAAVFIPMVTKKNNYLILGAGYNKLSLKNSLNKPLISNLGALSIQLGGLINLNNDWSLTGMMIQKISSDFEDLSKKDYQIGAIGFLTKKLNKHVKYKLGLFYNQEFWGPQIFPILGFDFILSDKLRFFGLLPRIMTLEYQISKSGYLGFKFNMKRTSYRLEQQYTHGYVQEFKIETQGYIDYYLSDVLTLFGTFGYAPIRTYKIFETSDILSEDYLAEFDNQIMAQVGLAIRIRSDN